MKLTTKQKLSIRSILYWVIGFSIYSVASAQTCNTDVSESASSLEFNVLEDGTVTHKETGLMWMQCSLGQTWNAGNCEGNTNLYNWSDALLAASNTTFANYDDWRLPNLKELSSILEYQCYLPSINLEVFPNTPETSPNDQYWTGTPHHNESPSSFSLLFSYGYPGRSTKDSSFSVRLVRQ